MLNRALKAGLFVRTTGDTIAMSPPLIISEDEIASAAGILGEVLDGIA